MPPSPLITVAIARFEDLLAHGLRGAIQSDPAIEIVAADIAPDRLDVVLRALRPRVAILDVDALPSLAEIRRLGREHPDTRLVLLVTHTTTAECSQALAFGASAYLGRDTQARDVQNAIHLASRGLQLIPRARGDSPARPLQGSQLLTQREAEVLPLLQQGSSNAEIAARLGVGVETIRSHARNIYRKLGVSSRRELTALPPRPSPENADTVAPGYPARRWATPGRGRQRRPGSVRR